MSTFAALLVHVIDYAGLYPPASLEMREAVSNFASYAHGTHSWMLGRLIVPAARLEEFQSEVERVETDLSWRLSIVGSGNPSSDLKAIEKLSKVRKVRVDAIEMKIAGENDVSTVLAKAPKDLVVYCEAANDADVEKTIEAIGKAKRRAKVRTGGVTPDAIPSSEQLAEFMIACRKHQVPFKATAGLHHPLRSVHRLTYEEDSPVGTMHGFLNVFLAASWIYDGLELQDAVELLEERSEASFLFADDEVRWQSKLLPIASIIKARKHFAISFGSCSFEEPVDDLKSLRLL